MEFSKGRGGLCFWDLVILSSIEVALALVMIASEQPNKLQALPQFTKELQEMKLRGHIWSIAVKKEREREK